MIPKKIHYFWFGGKPLPPFAEKCISSWKKFFPDYEIIRWDESNFDINVMPFTKEAYEAKKYAFVSDVARLIILYQYGGIYFDTDVEVIKPFNEIIEKGPFFGCENPYIPNQEPSKLNVALGLGFGVEKENSFIKELIDFYSNINFTNKDGSHNLTTIVELTTNLLCNKGLINTAQIQKIDNINIYPKEFFCPYDLTSGKLKITNNSHSIHHYAGTWLNNKSKLKIKLSQILGPLLYNKIKSLIKPKSI